MTVPQTYRAPLVVAALALLVTPFIAGSTTHLDTSRIIAMWALIAVSLGICYGQAGILSVGQAAFASLGAYATAIATSNYDLPMVVGLGLSLLVPVVLAYPLARVIVRLSPLALALSTLVLSEILHHALSSGGDFTGGFIGISGIPRLPGTSPLAVHFLGWGAVLLAVIVAAHLRDSTQGRALRIISKDQVLARSLGVPVESRLSAVFALSSLIAGFAGWLYAHTTTYLAPESLPLGLSITIVIMVIVGGKSTVFGPVLGAIILTFILDYLPREAVQGLFYGGALVLVLLLFPEGILGRDWRGTFRRRSRGSSGEPQPLPEKDPPELVGQAEEGRK